MTLEETTLEARVVAVLVGHHPLLGTVREKQRAPDGQYLVTTAVPEVAVTLAGFAGDRHAGLTRRADVRAPWYPRGAEIRNSRQVSLVAVEELAAIAVELGLPAIEPALLGANLALAGVPALSGLPPLTHLFFPTSAVLVVEGENEPCAQPGRVLRAANPTARGLAQRFPRAARGRRGLVGWVERAGTIRAGDRVRVVVPAPARYYQARSGR